MPKSYSKNIATYLPKVAQDGPESLAELYGINTFSDFAVLLYLIAGPKKSFVFPVVLLVMKKYQI